MCVLGLAVGAGACTVDAPPDAVPDTPDAAPPVDASPSTATNLRFDTQEDTPIIFAYDARDADGHLRQIAMRPPAHGALTCDGITCTYTPHANYNGHDNLAIAVGLGDEQVASSVDVVIASVNDVPVAQPDTFAMLANTELDFEPSALVANDVDMDGDALAVTGVGTSQHGAVSFDRGAIAFVPDPGFVGAATFDYTVSDGFETVLGHATVEVAD